MGVNPRFRNVKVALIVEDITDSGEVQRMIYEFDTSSPVELDMELEYNVFDYKYAGPTRRHMTVRGYAHPGRAYNQPMPTAQEELENPKAITDGNDEIVIDEDDIYD